MLMRNAGWTWSECRSQPAKAVFDLLRHFEEWPPSYVIDAMRHLNKRPKSQQAAEQNLQAVAPFMGVSQAIPAQVRALMKAAEVKFAKK